MTGTFLSRDPLPQIFTLSLVKAAQRDLTHSLSQIYDPQGVHVGMIRVMGAVDPAAATLSPNSIDAKVWELFNESQDKQTFEIEVKQTCMQLMQARVVSWLVERKG